MAKYRALYALVWIGSAVFALSYESKLTFVLFAGATVLPVLTLVLMVLSGALLKLEVAPDAGYVGKLQDFGIKVKVVNRFAIPVSPMMIIGTFHDRSGSVIEGRRLVMSIAPLRKCEYVFDGCIRCRGEYILGIEHAEIFDLLRIFRFRLRKTPMCRVVVMPRRIMLDEAAALCTDDYDSSITKISFMESGSFASVRQYKDGDLMKHVHWKLSAKHDELMVRQSEQNLGSSAVIITDLHSVSEIEEEDLRAADAAVETALALTRKIIADGRTAVNIYRTGDARPDVMSAAKPDDYEHLLAAYSVIPVTEAGAGAEALAQNAGEYLTGSEPVFVITTELDGDNLASIQRTVGKACGEIRVYLTGSRPDASLLARAEASKNTSVWRIDPEDISLSLRESMQPSF